MIYEKGRRDGWTNLADFSLFRLNNLWNTNLWILSIDRNKSLVLVNDDVPTVRNLGLKQKVSDMNGYFTSQDGNLWVRSFGFETVEKNSDGIVIRSSGIQTTNESNRLTNQRILFRLNNPNESNGETHIRLWLSDRLWAVNEETDGATESDPTELYPIADISIIDLVNLQINDVITVTGRNAFDVPVWKEGDGSYRILYNEPIGSAEPSSMSIEATTIETMNLIPMQNAQCLFNGILFGLSSYAGGEIIYSSNPGTVYQEQTTALKVLAAGIGIVLRLVPMNTGVLAFGTKS